MRDMTSLKILRDDFIFQTEKWNKKKGEKKNEDEQNDAAQS